MFSDIVARLRHRIRHSRLDPSSARYREFSGVDKAQFIVSQLYQDIHLEAVRGCTNAAGTILWLKSLL